MNQLKLKLACWNYDRTRGLMDGSVQPEGIDLTYENLFPGVTFARMMKNREFEVAELGLTFYLASLHLDDPPFVAIPVFPMRVFSHSAIYVNAKSGIEHPRDLIGRKVGEFFVYGHDAGTWTKGILSDEYDVPFDACPHFIGGVEKPTPPLDWYPVAPPTSFSIQHIGTGTTLDAMLEAGEIDALHSALVPPSMMRKSKKVRRLFADVETVERDYYKRSGIFPIQHIVAIRKDVYQKNPWIAQSLYAAFKQARDAAYATYRYQAANMHRMFMIPWMTHHCVENEELMSEDWFSYGLKRNRPVIDRFLRYHYEQGTSKRRFTPEELFLPETLDD
jgi:4,5-dihydroxyphthalate decarboxylase